MTNKKLILTVAAGVAAISLLGLAIKKKSKKKKFKKNTEEAKSNFKSKLHELQRKAQREYQNSGNETRDAVNAAKERANQWVNRVNKA